MFLILEILVMILIQYRYSNHDSTSSSIGLRQAHTNTQVHSSIHAMTQHHMSDEQMNLVGHSMVRKMDSVGQGIMYHSSNLLLVRIGLKLRKIQVIISR